MKYLRDYEIIIQTPTNEIIEIKPPISVTVSVDRNTLSSANTGSITIINLSENIRNKLYKDRYTTTTQWQVIIYAGYDEMKLIFKGEAREIQSYKQGTEWYTVIDAMDTLFQIQNAYVSKTLSKNTSDVDAIRSTIASMKNVGISAIGSGISTDPKPRGQVLMGRSHDVLLKIADENYTIDNGMASFLVSGEYIAGNVVLLTSDELLTTPRRRETMVDVQTIFMPEAQIYILVQLESKEKIYNRQYVCYGIKHTFEWSGASCGSAITDLALYYGAEGLKEVQSPTRG